VLLPDLPLNPLQIRSIVECEDARISAWIGAVRSGKTIAALWAFLIGIAAAPESGLILLVGRTLQTIERNMLDPLADREIFGSLVDHVEHNRGASTATILGRTVHLIGAADVRAEGKLRGLTAYLAMVDEATLIPEEFFTQLLARLSTPGARLLLTSNPDGPGHWLRKKFLQRAADLGLRTWNFTLHDNPKLPPDFVADLKRELTGVFYRRMVLGEWVAGEGAIFDMFDEDRHVIDELPPIARYLGVGVDFGMNHPTHAVMLALATDGRLVVTSEYRYDAKLRYGAQLTIAQVSAALKDWVGPRRPEWVCVDPSAEVLEVQMYYDGWTNLMHADNAVLDGIRLVASLLATDQLVVHRSCEALIEEFPSYAWDEKAAERGDEKPIKAGDDAVDSVRYVIRTTQPMWQNQIRNPLLVEQGANRGLLAA
jgi:PBSX family phage terminase large subunit